MKEKIGITRQAADEEYRFFTNQADWTLNFCKINRRKLNENKSNKQKISQQIRRETYQLSKADTRIHIGGEAAWREA